MATRRINPSIFPSAYDCILKGCEEAKKNCKTCGWNRAIAEERKQDIEENGLMYMGNGTWGYIPKEFRNDDIKVVRKHV